VVTTPASRAFSGLMGRRGLPTGGGLILQPCVAVVSFLMRFEADVVVVGGDSKVLHMIHPMRPWRTSKIVRGSRLAIELPASTLANTGMSLGDTITIGPV
jgi:uncharacterized protein